MKVGFVFTFLKVFSPIVHTLFQSSLLLHFHTHAFVQEKKNTFDPVLADLHTMMTRRLAAPPFPRHPV